MQPSSNRNLIAQSFAISAIEKLEPLIARVRRRNRGLADQLERAATSVALNVAEAAYSAAGNRRLRLESARGSANEARAALAVACAWRYLSADEVAPIDALYDRVLASTYKLWRDA